MALWIVCTVPSLAGPLQAIADLSNAKPSSPVQARLALSNPAPLPGEEVQLYVDLLIRRGPVGYGPKVYPHFPVRGVTLTLPALDGASGLEMARPLADALRDQAVKPGQHGFHVSGMNGEVMLEHEAPGFNGEPQWYRRRLTLPLRVRQAGPFSISPGRAAGEVFVVGAGGKGRWEPFLVSSEPLTGNAGDLPNRPKDFTGAIGTFRLSARAERTEMPVGTPFTLTLRLEGKGSLSSARPPDLAGQPGFADPFSVHENGERTRPDGSREFTYTLRPRSETVKEIPAISVSYFNPRTNRFETAQSQAIPLRVTPAAPLAATAIPDEPAPADEKATTENQSPFALALPWLGMNLVILLGVVGSWLLTRRWRQLQSRWIVRTEGQVRISACHKKLNGPHLTVTEVRTTLQDYLRSRFHLPPGEITSQDAREALERAGLGQELAQACAEVLNGCEAAEFAPGPGRAGAADLALAAEKVMRALRTAKPGQPRKKAAALDEWTRERAAAVAD
jgi:hypothetical protein